MEDRRFYFERNLLALSSRNPALCSRLSGAESTLERYRFLESRSGEIVPAVADKSGAAHPLHSTIDPRREAERLIATLKDEGFIVFLGLGGGYGVEAALQKSEVVQVIAIDYDINGMAELFCSREYIEILKDPRFTLLVDPSPQEIEQEVLELYRPALAGGIRTFPLRARTEQDIPRFSAAAETIQRCIEKVSTDYSVQAYFGTRWFSNIIRNLPLAEKQNSAAPPLGEAAVCAAGPSLDRQIPLLEKQKKAGTFIISADTALPALLRHGIEPDAAVSIDCQHISYHHFMGIKSFLAPLFLDIASPPLLSSLSARPFFFSGGHPLALYLSRVWRPLPLLDTSGGNVTYACLSLAESLGARRISVYGADFSYPSGKVYARGTYLYPFFEKQQTRLCPLESLFSSFLYRSRFLPPEDSIAADKTAADWRENGDAGKGFYETASLRFYRKRFEEKAASMDAEVIIAPGNGAPIVTGQKKSHNGESCIRRMFAPGRALMSSREFLEQYRKDVSSLDGESAGMKNGKEQVFTTLLPLAAAIKHRMPELKRAELIEAVKDHCLRQIDRVLW